MNLRQMESSFCPREEEADLASNGKGVSVFCISLLHTLTLNTNLFSQAYG